MVSVKLLQTPDQDFFRISFLWPTHIPIVKINGFEKGEGQNINGQRYQEFDLFVDNRLWPGQEMKIIGGRGTASLEYEFNHGVYINRHKKAFELYYTLFLQSWQPVQGSLSFEKLNNY